MFQVIKNQVSKYQKITPLTFTNLNHLNNFNKSIRNINLFSMVFLFTLLILIPNLTESLNAQSTPVVNPPKQMDSAGTPIKKKSKFTLQHSLKGKNYHKENVFALSFSPDEKYLLTGGKDKLLKVWDLSKKAAFSKSRQLHDDTIIRTLFDKTGKLVITSSKDKSIKIWNFDEMLTLDEINPKTTFQKHTDWVLGLDLSDDNAYLVSSDKSGSLLLWGLNPRKEVFSFEGHRGTLIHSVVFSKDGNRIISGDGKGTIKFWKVDRANFEKTNEKPTSILEAHKAAIWSIAVSPDNKQFATVSTDQSIKVWNMATKNLVFEVDRNSSRYIDSANLVVKFSNDGELLLVGNGNGRINFFRISSKKLIKTVRAHKGKIFNMKFSRSGKLVATSGSDKVTKIWSYNY